jgi:hypothetical protein
MNPERVVSPSGCSVAFNLRATAMDQPALVLQANKKPQR